MLPRRTQKNDPRRHRLLGGLFHLRLGGAGTTEYGWAQPFPADLLPTCITRCTSYSNETLQPTCRNCDVPYEEGNFTIIVDGFLVTQNVTCVEVKNVYTSFTYSDHCPVVMQFKLN